MAGRMPRTMHDIEFYAGRLNHITIFKPLVRLKNLGGRKIHLTGRFRQPVNPELVANMRADNRYIPRFGHLRHTAHMVEMTMRHKDFFNSQTLLVNELVEQFNIAARVNNSADFCFLIPEHSAILLERGHRNYLIAYHGHISEQQDKGFFISAA